jgi:8-oxo-dGTP diphosphatase
VRLVLVAACTLVDADRRVLLAERPAGRPMPGAGKFHVCRRWAGVVTAQEGQKLAWVKPNRLRDYAMPPADLPLIPHLVTLL